MSDYIIATSSTSDLTRDYLDEHQIPFISYSYTIGETVYEDDCRESSRAAVYQRMRRGDTLKTSMINEYAYYEFFKGLLSRGKDVIYLDMSVKMSTSFANAAAAADKVRAEYPDQRFYVMDTRCISGGLGLLVQSMVERKEQGMGFDEVIAWGEAHKLKIAHRFTVDDLKWLRAGGRVSNISAILGTMLSIKPVLYVPDAGTLDAIEKARGRKSAIKSILDGIKRDFSQVDPAGHEVHLLHADCLQDAETLRDGIKAAFPQIGPITITSLGVVIGAHTGPGLLTAFYYCGGRQK